MIRMNIRVDPNMTKQEAKEELQKLNRYTWIKERMGSRFDLEEIVEIKSKQAELEKIYGGTDWL
jgi:hypothetical protein